MLHQSNPIHLENYRRVFDRHLSVWHNRSSTPRTTPVREVDRNGNTPTTGSETVAAPTCSVYQDPAGRPVRLALGFSTHRAALLSCGLLARSKFSETEKRPESGCRWRRVPGWASLPPPPGEGESWSAFWKSTWGAFPFSCNHSSGRQSPEWAWLLSCRCILLLWAQRSAG